nr:MAG TPA: hypothetical protein [Bacteriophage sp.]
MEELFLLNKPKNIYFYQEYSNHNFQIKKYLHCQRLPGYRYR